LVRPDRHVVTIRDQIDTADVSGDAAVASPRTLLYTDSCWCSAQKESDHSWSFEPWTAFATKSTVSQREPRVPGDAEAAARPD
jgi:hypothetical protein